MKDGLVVKYTLNGEEIELTKEKVTQYCLQGTSKELPDEEFIRFANVCKSNNLNPWTREAYCIATEYNGKIKVQVMIGKEGYFKMADSNPDYDGMQDGIIVQTKDGEICELEGCFTPPNSKLLGGWAKAYSKTKRFPKVVKVNFSEYNSGKNLWASKPAIMINKVAKCTALRDMFPQTYAGTYDESELDRDDIKTTKNTKDSSKTVNTTVANQETTPAPKEEPKKESVVASIGISKEDIDAALEYEFPAGSGKNAGHKLQEFLTDEKSIEMLKKMRASTKPEFADISKAAGTLLIAIEAGILKLPKGK